MWQIYDDLIAAIPEESVVSTCMIGLNWILVRSDGVGVAMTPRETIEQRRHSGPIAGMRTRDLAQWVKSWNFLEAAVGLAAINSALNAPAIVEECWRLRLAEQPNENLFDHLAPLMHSKKVAVIGHFYGIESLAESCSLTILERRPSGLDFPDPACEYLLGEQDLVIMTATTLINKTMPRLLQLGRGSRVVVCGPSTPLSPILAKHGVDLLGGLVVEDEPLVWRAVQEGVEQGLLCQGTRMVNLSSKAQQRT